jgi:hypothetical protein
VHAEGVHDGARQAEDQRQLWLFAFAISFVFGVQHYFYHM